jgi:hypothetical protein
LSVWHTGHAPSKRYAYRHSFGSGFTAPSSSPEARAGAIPRRNGAERRAVDLVVFADDVDVTDARGAIAALALVIRILAREGTRGTRERVTSTSTGETSLGSNARDRETRERERERERERDARRGARETARGG